MNAWHQAVDAGGRLPSFPHVGTDHPLERFEPTPYVPKPYDPSAAVEELHHFPRFGHTNNFEALVSGLSGSSDTASNYIVGVVAGAMLILAIALVWGMAIVGLRMAGQRRVGFLAGRLVHPDEVGGNGGGANSSRRTLPAIEEEPEDAASILDSEANAPLAISDEILERAKKEKRFDRTVRVARIAFVLGGLAVIVSSILFYVKGAGAFKQSLDSVHGGLDLVQQTARKAIDITDNAIRDKNALLGDLNRTKTATGEELCPGDGGPIAETIKNRIDEFESELKDLSRMMDENVGAFGNDLRRVVEIAEEADEKLTSADVFFYVAMTITVVINAMILAMLAEVGFSARGVSNRCTKFTTHAILWPVFIFFFVLAWMFALLFLVASLAGSDFCVKPDQIVQGLLYDHQDQFGSAIFEYVIYYISGCAVKPDESKLEAITTQIDEVLDGAHRLSKIMTDASIPQLQSQCGLDKAAATALDGSGELLHDATHAINRGWISVRQMLECRTFNPIYTTFVHDAFCVEGVDGLTWLYSSALSMSIFAMLMIMFRAGLYPAKRPSAAKAKNSSLVASLLTSE